MQITRRSLVFGMGVGGAASVATFAFPRFEPMLAFAQENAGPLRAPPRAAALAAKISDKPSLEALVSIHGAMRVDGAFGIKFKNRRGNEIPSTAEEVEKKGAGDCDELSYYAASAMVKAGLDIREDCKLVALLMHLKNMPPEVWHIMPAALLKNAPASMAYPRYSNDVVFAAVVMSELGITGKWDMMILNPQEKEAGKMNDAVEIIAPMPLVSGLESCYYDERGAAYIAQKNYSAAQAELRKAVGIYPHPFSHRNLSTFEMQKKNISKALEHARKAHEKLPDDPGIRQNLAIALIKAAIKSANEGKLEDALELLMEAKGPAKGNRKLTEDIEGIEKTIRASLSK